MSDTPAAQARAALQRQLVLAILGNERVARRHGLLVTDLQTLHLLVLRDDVRTPRQISDTTGMPTSTVTKLIDRLEAAGYVRRASDPSDRRRTVLELVPEAIAPLTALYGGADEALDGLSAAFSPEELEVVVRYLDAVSDFYSLPGTGWSATA
ncbi:MarR family transcriptional regulator [Leucobacter weissii]|uniref:MarR family transcriptional regulator n=1 Tax=Leucobacter weissii TaxID=1983706 RepID=A0A939MP84_9MICO|nr:MarR family transcriptional regulator [Leucobacter weissii]MBO1902432.1 MarR family transcriptional regulator [Leucobacter weissii]